MLWQAAEEVTEWISRLILSICRPSLNVTGCQSSWKTVEHCLIRKVGLTYFYTTIFASGPVFFTRLCKMLNCPIQAHICIKLASRRREVLKTLYRITSWYDLIWIWVRSLLLKYYDQTLPSDFRNDPCKNDSLKIPYFAAGSIGV